MLEPIIARDATIAFSPDGTNWTPLAHEPELPLLHVPAARVWTRERRHTTSRHIRAVRLWRARQILRTIPTDLPLAQYLQYRRYVAKAVSMFGRRQLARVVWPWLPRQKDAGRGHPFPGKARRAALRAATVAQTRTPRGRPSNPTARP